MKIRDDVSKYSPLGGSKLRQAWEHQRIELHEVGFVPTPHGLVGYDQFVCYDDKQSDVELHFVHGKRCFRRVISGRSFTERGIKIVARRYAAEVVEGNA